MTGSTLEAAAPGTSAAPSSRPTPAALAPTPASPATVERRTAPEDAPPPTPPEAVQTTIEELPAGFWDDEQPTAAPQAIAERRAVETVEAPVPSPRPAPRPPAAPAADARTATGSSPPALASLQGLALVQAVFPGRVVKIERTATADNDATVDEPAIDAPIDAPDDDPETGADAPPPRTP